MKQKLIDHELGHCVLGRIHTDEVSEETQSIMYYANVYSHKDYNELRKELFSIKDQGKLPILQSFIFQRTNNINGQVPFFTLQTFNKLSREELAILIKK